MGIQTWKLVLSHSKAKGTAKVVMLGLADHDGRGGIWPSIATLARYANVHESNVQKAIASLVKAGELVVHRQAGGSEGLAPHERPNLYVIKVACDPATCEGPPEHRPRRRPECPADLWIEGVANSLPGSDSTTPPPSDSATPPGSADATRTTPLNHPLKSLPPHEGNHRTRATSHDDLWDSDTAAAPETEGWEIA